MNELASIHLLTCFWTVGANQKKISYIIHGSGRIIHRCSDGGQVAWHREGFSTLTFWFWLSQNLHDLGVGGVLAQSPHDITALRVGYFHLALWGSVKQHEGLFELCGHKARQLIMWL